MAAAQDDDEPPIRIMLAALFMAARLVSARPGRLVSARPGPLAHHPDMVKASIEDADELIRQAST